MKASHLMLFLALLMPSCTWFETLDIEHQISDPLETEIDNGTVHIDHIDDRIQISIKDTSLYEKGSAELSVDGRKILNKMIAPLKNAISDHLLQVEGRTDEITDRKTFLPQYRTTCELSNARVGNLVEYLRRRGLESCDLHLSKEEVKESDESRTETLIPGQTGAIEINLVPFNRATSNTKPK